MTKKFLRAIDESARGKTKPYDASATVLRVEGQTAYVHIPGGVDETPVQLTIDAKPGDTVRVRVSNNQAWLTGNGSAPPTDDTVAVKAEVKAEKADVLAQLAKKTADQAGKTATNYLSWSSEYGLIVSEDATEDVTEMQGGNTRITSDGMEVYKGNVLLARFGQEVGLYSSAGVPLAYFGYSRGPSGSGNYAQYYSLGVRTGDAEKYSVALGYMTEASGQRSQAQNNGTIAASWNQTAIGSYNERDSIGKYAFIIGNGESNNTRSNALTVDWSGEVTHSGDGTISIGSDAFLNKSGASVSGTLTRYGKINQLVLYFTSSSSFIAGGDIFTGKFDTTAITPPSAYVTGAGYYGARSIVGRITSAGNVVVRNASSTALTNLSDGVYISFTYIVNV